MAYKAPTWRDGQPPAISAEALQEMSDALETSVNYNTPQTLTPAQQVQARENINAPAPYTAGQNISISGTAIGTKAFPCNPNLLDNWYFGNPVNQRGQASYTGAEHTVDRWATDGIGVIIDNGTIRLSGVGIFYQKIENVEDLMGKTLVFSMLLSDGTLVTGSWILQNETTNVVIINDYVLSYNLTYQFVIYSRVDSPRAIKAIKLELGSEQTLAHQENGVWVLNEIPKFGDQLAECQRCYYQVSGTGTPLCTGYIYSAENALAVVELPATMRVSPAITISGNVIIRTAGGTLVLASTVANYGFGGDRCQLYFTSTGASMTPGSPCDIYMSDNSVIAFSAEL